MSILPPEKGGAYLRKAEGYGVLPMLSLIHIWLMARRYLALSGMKGEDTLSTVAVSVRGWVKPIGQQRLEEILEKNPYMREIYPTEASRRALEVFCLYRGEGASFDLSPLPPFRQTFSFGGEGARASAYQIDPARCIHCGNCAEACPVGAAERPS